jgi:radical SAM superfamily enzyme YgiQ (UPF0313 family)
MPKITLVELPATSFGKLNAPKVKDVYTRVLIPARANPQLQAILLQEGYGDVKSIDLNLNKKGKLTKANLKRIVSSDYLLLSSITRTIPQTKELAKIYKKANPNGKVIAGGPHVTFTPEETLEWADVVVRHEGDKILVELLEKLEKKESLENVKGISYKINGKVVNNECKELLSEEELSTLPNPDYSIYPKKTTGIINTSRGCPYACNFCCVTQLYGNKYRRKSNKKILEELNLIRTRSHGVFFSDDNFAANKSATKELLREIIKSKKNKMSYSCQLSINSAFTSLQTNEIDTEFIELLRRARFSEIYLGIESINEETLKSYNKPSTAERNKIAVKVFRDVKLWVHGMMMIGGEGDTPKSLDEELEWAKQNLDSVQFFAPIPFPKTRFTDEMDKQGRILTRDYCLYDGIHVIVRPKNFSPYELQLRLIDMHKQFYTLRKRDLIRKSCHPWYKRAIHAYAKKILWDIEHEPQTIAHLKMLRELK